MSPKAHVLKDWLPAMLSLEVSETIERWGQVEEARSLGACLRRLRLSSSFPHPDDEINSFPLSSPHHEVLPKSKETVAQLF